jgi:hypothetical protein
VASGSAGVLAAGVAWVSGLAVLGLLGDTVSVSPQRADAARVTLAVVITSLTIVAALIPLAVLPWLVSARFHLDVRLAAAVGALVAGGTAHWMLVFVSTINSCNLFVSFPYEFVDACRR